MQAFDQAEYAWCGIGRPAAVKRSYQSVSTSVESDIFESDVLCLRSRVRSDGAMVKSYTALIN